MKADTAIKEFYKNLGKAKVMSYINKPISWALYQTWKWADEREKPRGVDNDKENT